MTTRRACYSRIRRHDSRTYRSGLEETTSDFLKSRSINPHYEEFYIDYVVPESSHTYTPDFVLPNGIIIETKGVWDAEDRRKHLLIRQQKPDLDIRFVFNRSKTPIYKGSKTTYADFCIKNGILFADKTIPDSWLTERGNKKSLKLLRKKAKRE